MTDNIGINIKYIRAKEVSKKLSLGMSSLYYLLGNTDFPKPYRVSEKIVIWKESEIDLWLENKKGL